MVANQGYADNEISDTQRQLDKISQIVAEIEQELQKSQKNHKLVENELAQLEQEIGKLHQQIDASKRQIKTSKEELASLEKQSSELKQQINLHSDHFRQQIRLAYSAGEQSKWKLLLSQHSLQNVGRNAVIYDFIHQAQARQIKQMQLLTQQVAENQTAKQQEHEKLQNLLKKQSNAQSGLQKARKEKQLIGTQLAKSIDASSARLKKEKAKQNQLQKLLKKLTVKHTSGKFSQQKGKLHWPVKGNLKHRFGETRQSSAGIEWNGALIRANRGVEIKAIYPGTVVFSDWFDHYGWLIIIDHGDGYLSLYAHAEGLYKQVDDEVSAGELIAVVGDSGDINETGLYFEIRRQGTPVDPAGWCATPNMAYSP